MTGEVSDEVLRGAIACALMLPEPFSLEISAPPDVFDEYLMRHGAARVFTTLEARGFVHRIYPDRALVTPEGKAWFVGGDHD